MPVAEGFRTWVRCPPPPPFRSAARRADQKARRAVPSHGRWQLDFKDSYTAGLSLSYQFVDWGPHIRWELEGQALKHFGEQEHVEFAGTINARWITFPWNRYLDAAPLPAVRSGRRATELELEYRGAGPICSRGASATASEEGGAPGPCGRP